MSKTNFVYDMERAARQKYDDMLLEYELLQQRIFTDGADYSYKDTQLLRDLEVRLAILCGEDIVVCEIIR